MNAPRYHAYWMRLFGILYLGFSIVVCFFPSQILALSNLVPEILRFLEPAPVHDPTPWTALAASQFLSLAIVAFFSSLQPSNKTLSWILIAANTAQILALGYDFFNHGRYFIFGVGMVFAGFVIGISLWLRLSLKLSSRFAAQSLSLDKTVSRDALPKI